MPMRSTHSWKERWTLYRICLIGNGFYSKKKDGRIAQEDRAKDTREHEESRVGVGDLEKYGLLDQAWTR